MRKRQPDLLLAESALKRTTPGWHIPNVDWHVVRRVDNGCDEPYIDIPQHGMTVPVSRLYDHELLDVSALRSQLAAVRAALKEAASLVEDITLCESQYPDHKADPHWALAQGWRRIAEGE